MRVALAIALTVAGLGSGCMRVKVEPIHVTVDVNVRIQRELDSIFDDIDSADPLLKKTEQKKAE